MQSEAKTVAEYMKSLPDDTRKQLAKLRALMRKVAPEAKESMQYGMPAYDLNGMLWAFNAQKNYMALYGCGSVLTDERKSKIGKVNCGKGCIRFKKLEDLDLSMVEEMLTASAAKARSR